MNLEKTRKRIDLIDSEIMKLLNERMEVALSSIKFKEKAEDLEREKTVIENVKKWKGNLIEEKFAEEIFRKIMIESRKIQEKNLTLIGIQGGNEMTGKKIAIIGTGNMGAWIAKKLSEKNSVAVFDLDKSKAEKMKNAKVLSNLSELKEFNPELLINAVSLQNTIKAFNEAVQYIPKECIIADVASIKGIIPEYYAQCGFRFVSTHPMFGPTFADLGQLDNENAIIIRESDKEGAAFFRELFNELNLNIFEYSFEEHDVMMAYSLSLPFISSMVFAACVKPGTVPGTTFAKHKNIAAGLLSEDDNLLSEILFNTHTLEQLDKITSGLEFLKHVIRAREYEEAKKVFEKLRKNVGE